MQILAEYGLFLAQTITFVIAALVLFSGLIAISARHKSNGKLRVTALNQHMDQMALQLSAALPNRRLHKQWRKQHKQQQHALTSCPCIFVIRFKGDMFASAVDALREEITSILTLATPHDRVLVCVESPGGTVPGYGLAAAQLQRLKQQHIPLTVAVDKVAASGGYLMACVADHILASPFAIIGSIGVISQLPNFNRLLKKHEIDFEQLTAGEYKRTLSLFGENNAQARDKAQHDLDAIHCIFKAFIQQHRPHVDLAKVATGEYWLAHDALPLGLVDSLGTSDDYLLQQGKHANLLLVQYQRKKRFGRRLQDNATQLLTKYLLRRTPQTPYAL